MSNDNRTEIASLGEFGLIHHLTDNILLQNKTSIKGVGDDAAILSAPENQKCLVSTDMLVEGVHFDLSYVPLKHLGYKSVVAYLSDICAGLALGAACALVTFAVWRRWWPASVPRA
jgi:thiamine-monophosphate kinase